MTNKNLSNCPVCNDKLKISSYVCDHCGIKIEGAFKQDKFASLSQEDKDFIELFVKKRGSIKEIEKELGISYPTVRNRLDQVIANLGHRVDPSNSRMEVLQMLDKGEITSDQARDMLAQIGKGE